MKKYSIICLLLSFSVYIFAQQQELIKIETKHTSIILGTVLNAPVYYLHWGSILNDDDEFKLLMKQRQNHALLYPTYANNSLVTALEIIQPDGVLTTELVYAGYSQKQVDSNLTETIIMLKDKLYPMEVNIKFLAYQEEDIIKQSAHITNKGNEPVRIEKATSSYFPVQITSVYLTWFSGSWAKEMQRNEEQLSRGMKVIESRKGVRTTQCESPLFLLSLHKPAEENSGEVYGGALAWSGNFKMEFEMDETGLLHVNSGANTFFATYHLEPGKAYETPAMILSYSNTGKGQISRNYHNWARKYNLVNGDTPRSILLNSWEGTYFDFDEKKITKMIDDAADLGIEMFVLDDGWFGNKYPRNNSKAGLGDWQVNEKKLPKGIAHLADYATKKGLKFGIWIEPEMVNPNSELANKHPDWIVRSGERSIPQQRNQWILDLTNPEVQEFVFNTFDQVVSLSPNISYIKWDANRHVNNMGSTYLPAGKQTHFWYEYVRGLYSVYERIRAKYPEIEIQACASGGGRIDFGSLAYHNEFWTSDNTNALDRIYIQDGISAFFPANAMGAHVSPAPNHQTGMTLPLKFRFDVAMAGRLGFELQPADIGKNDLSFVKEAIQTYKKIRPVVQLGDLYRLVSPYDNNGWSSLMHVSKNRSQAVLFAYSIDYHPFDKLKVKLNGLSPDKRYRVTELNKWKDRSRFYGNEAIFSGDFLMNYGLNLDINKPFDSVVLLLEKVETEKVAIDKDDVIKQTFTYAIKGNDTLRMDKYNVQDIDATKPCVIFVFGGGFKNGSRNEKHNVDYMHKLAQRGYVAVAIDYRLGMKEVKVSQEISEKLIETFKNSIHMAVDDLFDATVFVHSMADEWNISKEQIVINGSSAGAVTALQAAYLAANNSPLASKLPSGFKYGGVISFAGAILADSSNPVWPATLPPMQIFHGDADKNVPYHSIVVNGLGIYGSEYIAKQLGETQSPHYFYHVENAAHEIATTPMFRNLQEIDLFIKDFVLKRKQEIIYVKDKAIGIPEKNKNFTFEDYIQTNY